MPLPPAGCLNQLNSKPENSSALATAFNRLSQRSSTRNSLESLCPSVVSTTPESFFDSPGFLEQSQHWGGLVIWTIAAGTTASLFWAFFGRVDQTVLANGTLQLISGKMIVSSPAGGIVRELFVSDGEMVAKDEVLMVVESEGTKARLQSTQKQLALFRYENQLFNLLLDQSGQFDLNTLPEPPVLIQSGRSYSFSSAHSAGDCCAHGVVANQPGI